MIDPVMIDRLPILDPTPLADFSAGDLALAQSFLDEFFLHATHYLEELAMALDSSEWVGTAHRLKGAANSIGASRLAYWADYAERAAPSERESALGKALSTFQELKNYCGMSTKYK